MKINKSIYALILSTCLTNLTASDLSQQDFFNPSKKPLQLFQALQNDFKLTKETKFPTAKSKYDSEFVEHGFFGIEPTQELLGMMKGAPESKTEFFALELGSHEFAWALYAAEKLQHNLPAGKSLHLYSLIQENISTDDYKQFGNIHLHMISQAKLDYLNLEHVQKQFFKKIGGKEAKFDLIVSKFTFRNRVDPLGAFVNAYNKLAVNGIMMFDQVPLFKQTNQGVSDTDTVDLEAKLDFNQAIALNAMQEPYLMGPRTEGGIGRSYILKRTKDGSLQLPFQYAGSMSTQKIKYALDKTRAEYIFPENIKLFMTGKGYSLAFELQEEHKILRGNDHKFFNELYERNPYWKNDRIEWRSSWICEDHHPNDIREAQ